MRLLGDAHLPDVSDRPRAGLEPCAGGAGDVPARAGAHAATLLPVNGGLQGSERIVVPGEGGAGPDRFWRPHGVLLLVLTWRPNRPAMAQNTGFAPVNVLYRLLLEGLGTPGPVPPQPPTPGTTIFCDPSPLTLGEGTGATSLLGRRLGRLLLLRHRGGEGRRG